MTPILLGQLLGVSFACGLNLYLTVATIGVLSRFDLITGLPPGLRGLDTLVVITSAAALYGVEAVIDKIRHADSVWDAVHTFIRPPAAALLVAGALWGYPPLAVIAGSAAAFMVALLVHGTKAGLRLALNATMGRGNAWYSLGEDLLAVAFAVVAMVRPGWALLASGAILLVVLLVGPRFWRALHLGLRCLFAWFRAFFAPSRWREDDQLPRAVRGVLDPTPLAAAPPTGTAAALHGFPGLGGYRNGWLVLTATGPLFVFRTMLGALRRVDLPSPERVESEPGVWADVIDVQAGDGTHYTLYLLKDGPALETAVQHLSHVA